MNLFDLEVAFILVTLACNHHGHKSGLNVLFLDGWDNYFCV